MRQPGRRMVAVSCGIPCRVVRDIMLGFGAALRAKTKTASSFVGHSEQPCAAGHRDGVRFGAAVELHYR